MIDRYIEKFLMYCKVERNMSAHTVLNYSIDLRDAARSFGEAAEITGIDYLAVRKYLAQLKAQEFSKRSVARKLACLRSFFKFLHREGHIPSNPVSSVSTPKLDKPLPVFLDEDEIGRLLEAPDRATGAGLRDRAHRLVFVIFGKPDPCQQVAADLNRKTAGIFEQFLH